MAGKFGETKGLFWCKNRQKSLRNIFKTLEKNEQTLTAAECRIYCKSGILAGNFDLHFAHVLEVMKWNRALILRHVFI